MRLEEFLQDLGSGKPTPGGGSASALAGALGSALAQMVGNLTLKKAEGDKKEKFEQAIDKARDLQKELIQLVEKDAASFNEVMKAFRMPKETPEEKEERKTAIQGAFKGAAEVPLEIMEKALETSRLAFLGVEAGNPNCITDGGVGVLMARACIKGAAMNVKINLGSIKDKDFCSKAESRVQEILEESRMLEEKMERLIEEAI